MVTRIALFLVLMLTASITACSGPFVLLPGGALEGSTVAIPDSWAFTDAVKTVQLETRPVDPYSVNVWVIAIGENLYICLLYTSPSPRDRQKSRMPSSA